MIYENDMQNAEFPFKCAVMRGDVPFMNHCHQEMEILMLRKGELRVFYENEEHRLREGDIWIVPPFGNHGIGKGSHDCERIAVLLDLQLLRSGAKENQEYMWIRKELEKRDMFSGHWEQAAREKLSEIVEKMYWEYSEKKYAWKLAISALISELVLAALREMPVRQNMAPEKGVIRIKNILEYIALHYYSDITLQSCAAAVGFNSTYLSRYFSSTMGITFQEYIKRLRIDRAKWLLMTEKLPVMEVCCQSGFRDIKTFNKLFKKECGMSPTEFRKTCCRKKAIECKDMRCFAKDMP